MGYKRAGYEMVGCCEIDPAINKIYKANLHPKHNFLMDLRAFNELPDIPEELYHLDILDGSPPCSTFSMAGAREKGWGKEKVFREGQAKQTLDDLFFVYLKTVERLKPKVCVAENVTGLVKGNSKGYVNEIAKRFKALGYEVQLFLLNAAFMEVPQKRERVFFIANRMGYPKLKLEFNYKPIRFGEVKSEKGVEIAGLSLADVASTKRLLSKARPGDKCLADICERERGKGVRFTEAFVWDGDVAPTVISGGYMYRMPEQTYLSKEDYTSIGAFPQDYKFNLEGDEKKARAMCKYMVGMSVPPSMTAHIADQIWEQWLSKEGR
jgi:DNA (cytosine-5)-methyltransferase 1